MLNCKKIKETSVSSNRSFGFVFSTFLFIISVWPIMSGASLRPLFLVLSGLLLLIGLLFPKCLAIPNQMWLLFGEFLHKITSPIALGIIFYGLIAPIGVLLRIFGKDLLHLKFDSSAESYWVSRLPPGPAPDSLRNQF